jgi:two-component system phosphate regulon sensor histidine kinase PhoR
MRKTFLFKLFGGYVLILLALTLLFMSFSARTVRTRYLEVLTSRLEHLGMALEPQVLSFLDKGQSSELEVFLRDLDHKIKTRITVIDPEGKVLADSEENPETMESHRFRPEILEAIQGRVNSAIRYSTTVKEDMLYVGLPLERGGKIVGALRVSLFIREINSLLSRIKKDLWLALLVITALSLAGAFLFTRSLSRPVEEMIGASKRVAAGDFSAKMSIRRRGEWGELAESFNTMTAKLRTLFDDLTHQREELKGIIGSMEEGLMVVDKNDQIILSNASYHKLISQQPDRGKYYWEALRVPQFVELVKKVREEKADMSAELKFNNRAFLCRAAYLASRKGVIITFFDMTDIQNVVRMKKDFILNVSHELRTPLTAVKGFAETLEGEVSPAGREYLGIIRRNTDRLIRIIEDMLTLSELEEKPALMAVETVDLRRLADHVIAIFEPRAREKNLTIDLRADEPLPAIKGDPFRLEQMLINLIDNAVKYTEKGSVAVILRWEDGRAVVEVNDTGIGIPAEHLNRIFERFYVVDRSRSRKLGGTGLGLSIVKHIVSLHGGEIDVESTEGAGTRFLIRLPA